MKTIPRDSRDEVISRILGYNPFSKTGMVYDVIQPQPALVDDSCYDDFAMEKTKYPELSCGGGF